MTARWNPEVGAPFSSLALANVDVSGSVAAANLLESPTTILGTLDWFRNRLRNGLMATLSHSLAGIARALVLGENVLSNEDQNAFAETGTLHLLAVSGSHVALAAMAILGALRLSVGRCKFFLRRLPRERLVNWLGAPVILAYCQIAGDSGSARRATLMAIFVMIARANGRNGDVVRAFALSILCALWMSPLYAFDLSFMLSICATSGLIWLSPSIDKRLHWLPESVRAPLSATCAASIACGPLLLSMGAKLSWVSLPANLILVPIGEMIALPLANLLALIAAVSTWLATATQLASIVAGALRLLEYTATSMQLVVGNGLRYFLPSPVAMALLFLGVLILVHGRKVLTWKGRLVWLASIAGAFLVAEIVARTRFDSSRLLRISVLDVGQGDSILVDFPDGESMLIDGGGTIASTIQPGKQVILPLLAARRRWRVDYAVLTHPHPDHFLGLREVLGEISPREFWFNGIEMDWESALKGHGVKFQTPADLCGKMREIGGARVEVLAPCPSVNPDFSANNTSLVLKISYGDKSALLVGDSEFDEEKQLLAKPNILRADLLKVGHHGSKTSSSSEFVRAVSPSAAVISCGVRNHFGHPAASTIATLIAQGSTVFRTDFDGEIRWSTDGHAIWLQSAKGE